MVSTAKTAAFLVIRMKVRSMMLPAGFNEHANAAPWSGWSEGPEDGQAQGCFDSPIHHVIVGLLVRLDG